MIPATLDDRKARLLLRIRWLTWGAIAILVTAHVAVALTPPAQPPIQLFEQDAAPSDASCGCSHNPEII
ncbi:hypothetical protein AAG612_00310 [Citromicrobium bathyomarinum]|uniref:hypothetical protein n=1 Tax=Citromicrobium bathyomarinum TaxID=72174 RepID=UPI00315A8C8D